MENAFLNTDLQTDFSPATKTEALKVWASAAASEGASFAFWRKPESSEIHLLADFAEETEQLKPDIQNLHKGFLAAPFHNAGKAFFLRADAHYELSGKLAFRQSPDPNICRRIERFGLLLQKKEKHRNRFRAYAKTKKPDFFQNEGDLFRKTVRAGIKAVEAGEFQKIVPSRTKWIPLPVSEAEPEQLFLRLCKRYPEAFTALIASPAFGLWLCATPEILIAQSNDGIFSTIALAGTQNAEMLDDLRDAAWRQKEIEEQALVSRYIINCFKKIRLRDFREKGPRTVRAGRLIHLQTSFFVDTVKTRFPELSTVMLELLHPTSAVCGMPKTAALEFLRMHENYDRQLYSGFLGPVGFEGACSLYVHLRCMQLLQKGALLYAGAGVTADSDPDKEWTETELKCRTMGDVLIP